MNSFCFDNFVRKGQAQTRNIVAETTSINVSRCQPRGNMFSNFNFQFCFSKTKRFFSVLEAFHNDLFSSEMYVARATKKRGGNICFRSSFSSTMFPFLTYSLNLVFFVVFLLRQNS